MLIAIVVVLAAVIVALVITDLINRRRRSKDGVDTRLLRAGREDAKSSVESARSAINNSTWMRGGGGI